MRPRKTRTGRLWRLIGLVVNGAVLIAGGVLLAQTDEGAPRPKVTVLAIEGEHAWWSPATSNDWQRLAVGRVLGPGDRGRTGPRTRLMLRLADAGEVSIPERSEFLVEQPSPEETFSTFSILKGMGYFFHRGEPSKVRFKSRTASAAVRGTEFLFAVDEQDRTVLTLFDGDVLLENARGALALTSGEAGLVEVGEAPRLTPFIEANTAMQWRLYYPAVLDPDELDFDQETQEALGDSLAAYRSGNLQLALALYPTHRTVPSWSESIYLAALVLSVGQVAEAEALLHPVRNESKQGSAEHGLARSLLLVMDAVRSSQLPEDWEKPSQTGATHWLARSYVEQRRGRLEAAWAAAQRATATATNLGFTWVRLAELEFSLGRQRQALDSLAQGLSWSPQHAEAWSLRGYLLSARKENQAAIDAFGKALSLDGGLGHAWLGLGLARIRQGNLREGLVDLEVAAAMEPIRSVLRSYLGKAYQLAGRPRRAEEEMERARRLDPNDPTSWLYSALIHQQQNRINESVEDLETSRRLNQNRQIFRSRLLLDEDQAVRGANLAGIYADAGLDDVAFREAARAVNVDYPNYAAHVFLANSYQELRDPTRVGLRYDSAWFSEYLLANILAPPGAGVLSQTVSQQEYGRLFERNKLGLVASTDYLSSGDWTQAAALLGNYGHYAFAVDQGYQSRNGERPNNDLEQWTWSLQLKQQWTPEDAMFFQAVYFEAEGGDLAPLYDPTDPVAINRGLRFQERQEPILLGGYHHRWGPGSHTLVLAGRLDDSLGLVNPSQQTAIISRNASGQITDALPIETDQDYVSDVEIYTAEAQQIWQNDDQTWVAGSRFQLGRFETVNRQSDPRPPVIAPLVPDLEQDVESDLQRSSTYLYYHWRVVDPILLLGGLSYDWMRYPANHRYGPVTESERTADQFSPKAGVIWTPAEATSFRAGYARSLGGVSLDQSASLEPSQVAGFNQAFGSVIPESEAGSTPAEDRQTWGLEWDQKLATRTYLGMRGEWLEAVAAREVGVFALDNPPVEPASLRERLDYRERTLTASLHQLVGEEWALGAIYRLSNAELGNRFRGVPAGLPGGFDPAQDVEATLHQVRLLAAFNHASGVFGRAESVWSSQSNRGYAGARPDDDFWQFHVWAGYRFYRRRAELKVGLLNVTDRDYRLNPLNLTPEMQRRRTLAVSVKLDF